MKSTNVLPALVLSLGILAGSIVLGSYALKIKNLNRQVQVKGLAEKEVSANIGNWNLRTSASGNTQSEVSTNINKSVSIIKSFLLSKGFAQEEIKVNGINIRPTNYQGAKNNFESDAQVSVTSTRVDLIDQVSGEVSELISKGIILSGDRWSSGPRYFYTSINEIKPELLAEALKAAKQSAEEFARNSGSKVGRIKYANQGIIRLIPASRIEESHEFHKDKIIRVVSSVDYSLE